MNTEGGLFFRHEVQTVLTVSELTEGIGLAIEGAFPGFLYVEGEISNLKESSSGHVYFTLKDASAQIRAVFFRGQRKNERFLPREGDKVLATGRLTLYKPRGEYQIVVHALEPAGIGKFFMEFRRVQRKLEEEGLLASGRKRLLPPYPCKVALITSLQGAVVWDFLRIAGSRNRSVQIVILPVRVQGEGAALDMIEAFQKRIPRIPSLDAVILARGGGSVEDLWPFNSEQLARSILSCPHPVVSAVGHETNVTIADLVADLRVATPSEAAEKVVPHAGDLARRLDDRMKRMENQVRRESRQKTLRLSHLAEGILRWPFRLTRYQQDLDRMDVGLLSCIERKKLSLSRRGDNAGSRMQQAVFQLLARKRGVLESVVRRIRTPYALYTVKRKRREIFHFRLIEAFRNILSSLASRRLSSHERLGGSMGKTLTCFLNREDNLSERLRLATPFSALEKGFAILFHAADRTLVTPSRLPRLSETLIARIPGYEIGLEVKSVEVREKGGV